MRDRPLEEKPACATTSMPVPAELACPECKAELEIWSDESEVTCENCGALILKNRTS